MDIIIESSGNARLIYEETLDLPSIGQVQIRRGSHVEPTECGRWTADLSPVNGPELGPFLNRSEAIEVEVAWLRKYWLTPPDQSV